MIYFPCLKCGEQLEAPAMLAGHPLTCPVCRQVNPVPGGQRKARLIETDQRCPGCGFNMRGLFFGSDCPECGRAAAEVQPTGSVAAPRVAAAPVLPRRSAWEQRRARSGFRHWPALFIAAIPVVGASALGIAFELDSSGNAPQGGNPAQGFVVGLIVGALASVYYLATYWAVLYLRHHCTPDALRPQIRGGLTALYALIAIPLGVPVMVWAGIVWCARGIARATARAARETSGPS